MLERWVTAHSTVLEAGAWEVADLEGEEGLNALFRFDVHLVHRDRTTTPPPSEAELLDASVTLRFEDRGEVVASVHGIVSELRSRALGDHESVHLWLQVVPRVWLLTQRRASEVFLERSVPEVLAEKLRAIGLKEPDDFVFALQQDYPTREIIVQYDETDYAFVSRLCEQVGIITLFSHEDGRDCLILTDSQDRFRPIPGAGASLHVRSADRHPAAYDVERTVRRVPADALVHEYNYRTPQLGLSAQAPLQKPVAQGTWVQPGEHTKTPAETGRMAQLRSAQLGLDHKIVRGKSTEMTVHAGGTFVLGDALGHDEELLVLRVTHRAHQAAAGADASAGDRSWDNEFEAVPRATIYRPALRTPKPRVPGFLHAVVDGAIKGPYAELDESGRYHVRLGYDRSGRTDLGASHPVRMMQPHAGASYGMHFPLRPGAEVLVACVNGDPDRPIIVGSAPNPTTASPVQRANQTQNVLRTGSNNEIVIEDEIGIERIRIHTPHQNTTLQLGSIEEPEEGSLLCTEAHISEASRGSNNEATTIKTLLAQSATTLLGDSAVVLVGLPALIQATARGMEDPASVSPGQIDANLRQLARPPASEAEAADEPAEAEPEPDAGGSGGLWSSLGASLTSSAQALGLEAIRALSRASDEALDQARGRSQGQPLGELMLPAVIIGSPQTTGLFSRDRILLYGDRVATVSSNSTASVVGRELAELKSPTAVEIAAAEEVRITTTGLCDVAAGQVRVVAGYYPDYEPPPLDDGTSVGIMGRQDLYLTSIEHCILACAHKNLIATAHEGEMKLHAKQKVTVTAETIHCEGSQITLAGGGVSISGGSIQVDGSEITITAKGAVKIKGAPVEIDGGDMITLKASNVKVTGNLYVGEKTYHGG